MAANERLRDAITRAGLDLEGLAGEIEVDPKTVERWITKNRVPHAKSRAKAAAVLGETQSYLWPDAFDEKQRSEISESELVKIYHQRAQVEHDTWTRLLDQAEEHLDVLALAGLFFPEQQRDLAKTLCAKAKQGPRSGSCSAIPKARAWLVEAPRRAVAPPWRPRSTT
ncbi:MAG: hypothetical protein AAGA65_18080 [Actinomycetota bacterium]